MGDWPALGFPLTEHGGVLSNLHLNGPMWGYPFTAQIGATGTASVVEYTPIRVPETVTVYKLACGSVLGTTGNFDLGIFDQAGNKLVSTGSTAKTTANTERIVDVTDTVLLPGMYYLGFVADSFAGPSTYTATNTLADADFGRLMGLLTEAAVFPLPAVATFATWGALTNAPKVVAAYLRSE